MPLINCKIKWKLKQRKHCVLSGLGNNNDKADANFDNIIFTVKGIKLYLPVVNLTAKDDQKPWKLLSKGFERLVYWNENKTKSENKITTNEYIYFIESKFVGANRLFLLVYPMLSSITLSSIKKTFMIKQLILI